MNCQLFRFEKEKTIISLSAKSGQGIDLLKNHIKAQVGFQHQRKEFILRVRRHLDALARAQKMCKIVCSNYRNTFWRISGGRFTSGTLALCEITGEFTADDLFGRIFSSFCIGK